MKRIVVVLIASLLIAATPSAAVAAADNRTPSPFITGKVTAIGKTQLSLLQNGKIVTVPLASSSAGANAAPQNIKVGDMVKGQLQNGKIIRLQRLQ